MTREQKKIIGMIREIEEIVDTEEALGDGLAPDEFYEPVEGKMLALKEQLSFLTQYKDMMERAKASRVRSWSLKLLLFLYDAFAVNFAYFMAIVIRFSDSDSFYNLGRIYMGMFQEFAPWYTGVCLVLFLAFRIYNGVWRYAGSNDVKKLLLINLITCLIYIIGTLFIVGRMPITVYMAGATIQFVLMCIPRLAPRIIVDSFMKSRGEKKVEVDIPLMIVGIGENARIIQDRINKDITNNLRPVCVIDYTYSCDGKSFNGLPVFSGPYAVYECIKKFGIRCVVIADADIPKGLLKSIHKICDKKGIELRDFVIGTDNNIRNLRVKELLSTTEGAVRIICDGEDEKHYIDGKAAIKDMKDDYIVDKVSVSDGSLRVHIHKADPIKLEMDEEWIEQYREQTGSDVSFF